MKKTLVKMLAVVVFAVVCLPSFAGCAARDKTLRIYNWGEYMDETVIDSFKEWYKEEFEEDIKVVYKEFDSNETVETAISTKNQDWDLACPSDYMIDRFIENDLLLEISDVVDRSLINSDLYDMLKEMNKDSEKYTIPYIWGTFGIMYDSTVIKADEEMRSWAALWDAKYQGQVFMKDQVRDSYTVAMLYHHREELKAASDEFDNYKNQDYIGLLTDIFTKYDDDTMNIAKDELLKQKKNALFQYETDNGKMEMAGGKSNAKLGLFWSCDAGYVMNDYETEAVGCAKASVLEGNKNLRYVVPDEGSNVWVDGWVIPKFAKNKTAAERFLQYLLDPEIAKLNASYAGAQAANAEAMLELKEEIEADDEFFNGASDPEAFRATYLDMMFPDADILERCAVMGDFGDMYAKMVNMFKEVKAAKVN